MVQPSRCYLAQSLSTKPWCGRFWPEGMGANGNGNGTKFVVAGLAPTTIFTGMMNQILGYTEYPSRVKKGYAHICMVLVTTELCVNSSGEVNVLKDISGVNLVRYSEADVCTQPPKNTPRGRRRWNAFGGDEGGGLADREKYRAPDSTKRQQNKLVARFGKGMTERANICFEFSESYCCVNDRYYCKYTLVW